MQKWHGRSYGRGARLEGTVRYGGAKDAEIALEEATEQEQGWRIRGGTGAGDVEMAWEVAGHSTTIEVAGQTRMIRKQQSISK